jgi:DNA invertase Pin-like site-specific DNA recombinase
VLGVWVVKQYVIYKRVSTEDQGKSGLGLAAQERDIQLFLTGFTEVPYEVLADYTEIETGKANDRPILGEALALVRKTGADLLVAKLDRLSRKVSFISAVMDDPKVRLRVAAMPYADKFQLHIYAALAEQEREFISARTSATNSEYLTHSLLSQSRAPINRTARAGPPTLTSEVCLPIAVRLG